MEIVRECIIVIIGLVIRYYEKKYMKNKKHQNHYGH